MALIKCKFCNWAHERYYKNKRGKLVDGYKSLLHHIECCHEEEFEAIEDRLYQEFVVNAKDAVTG